VRSYGHQESNIPCRQQSAFVLILRFLMSVQALYKAKMLRVRALPVLIDNTSQVMRTRTFEKAQLLPELVVVSREGNDSCRNYGTGSERGPKLDGDKTKSCRTSGAWMRSAEPLPKAFLEGDTRRWR